MRFSLSHRLGLVVGLIGLASVVWLLTALVRDGSVLSVIRLARPLETSEGWTEDLRFLAGSMRRIHPDLFFALSEQEFESAVDEIETEIPQLDDEQIIVELMKLVALPGVVGGRDGHSEVPVFQDATGFHALPLRLYRFGDGWFVVDAMEPYKELIGQRLHRVGAVDTGRASALISPLVSRDNDLTVKARLGKFLLVPELLRARGIIDRADAVDLVLEDSGRQRHTVAVRPIAGEAYESWVDSQQKPENFQADFLESSQTLYIRYHAVRAKTANGETIRQFSDRIAAFVDRQRVERVVVDVRHNGGGNNYTYRPFLRLLTENEAINRPGGLFVVTGRNTFSAAGNFVTELARKSHALIVGEPMGGGLNQYGDSRAVTLPNSGLEVRIASRYWQKSDPEDERLTLSPDIPVELSSSDYFSGRDPALAAILAYE